MDGQQINQSLLLVGRTSQPSVAVWRDESLPFQRWTASTWSRVQHFLSQQKNLLVIVHADWYLRDTTPGLTAFFQACHHPVIVVYDKSCTLTRQSCLSAGAYGMYSADELSVMDLPGLVQSIQYLSKERRDYRKNSTDMSLQLSMLDKEVKELKTLAHHDLLTGLPSRRQFEKNLKEVISRARRHHHYFALLSLDLDRFKAVNDQYGHAMGDALLQQAAMRMQVCVREEDFLSRHGGDEFSVILFDLKQPKDAAVVAKKIIDAFSTPFQLSESIEASVGVSIGIACYPYAGSDVKTLTQHADRALYQAKSAGRNTFRYFTEAVNREHRERQSLAMALENGLKQKEFFLVYQPFWRLDDHQPIGVEVLLRWRHPDLGVLPAVDFLDIAKDSGLILELGQWVFSEALKQFSTWRRTNTIPDAFRISFNVCERQLLHKETWKSLRSLLTTYQIEPHCIGIEVAGSLMLHAEQEVYAAVVGLNHQSYSVVMDDYGIDSMTIVALQKMPIRVIKLDCALIQALDGDNKKAENLLRAVIAMTSELQLLVVAEGVETQYQADFLRSIGCGYAQGYFFSKPLDAAALAVLLEREPSFK